jgi:hypothetical protein
VRGPVPTPGRHGLDHGQGRAHPGSPGRGDHPKAGRGLGALYAELTREFGASVYERIDAPATTEQKWVLSCLSPVQLRADQLAGDTIWATHTAAPGNGKPILPLVSRHQGQGCTGYGACDGERGRYDHKSCEGPYARGPNDRAGHVSCIPHEHAGG